MKVAYAACDATKSGVIFPVKLARLFLPSDRRIGRMVKRRRGRSTALAEVRRGTRGIRTSFSNLAGSPESAKVQGRRWTDSSLSSVYIPVKEMLANAPGFRSLYATRSIHFEEMYSDILDRAFVPPLLGAPDVPRRNLLGKLRKALEGKVLSENEEFFLVGRQGQVGVHAAGRGTSQARACCGF